MRFLISNYYFNKDKKFNFHIADNNILMFPQISLMKEIVKKNDIIKNPFNISKYWLDLQKNVKIENGNVIFFKNHNALVSINSNEFTNHDHTLGAIYIVRDPRDVVVSYSHYKNESYDKVINDLCERKVSYNIRSIDNFPFVEVLGSWNFHYFSWKNGLPNMPRIIIKYEDMLNNCNEEFSKVIDFLSNLLHHSKDQDKIDFSVANSNFELLQKNEKKFKMKTNESKNIFFRRGKAYQWKKVLTASQIKKIENSCKKAMIDLDYI